MTNPGSTAAPLPASQPVRITQTQAAEAEQGVKADASVAQARLFRLGSKAWPLAESVSFVRAANIQAALNRADFLALAEQLPSIVQEPYRDEVRDYLLSDTESSDADHITLMDVIDAFSAAEEVLAARPTRR